MDAQLHAQLDEVIEEVRDALHQQAEYWSTIRTPSELFDFEQGLQAVLNSLQAGIVGAVLEAIHRARDFVTACQSQARRQRGVHNAGWGEVGVRTLGGHHVHLKTPYATHPPDKGQEGLQKKRHQHGTGLYPVLRRLGIVGRTTPRLLADVNRHLADGPSDAEAAERFASREIRLTQKPMWGLVRDFASIALWQRQAAGHLEQIPILDPAPLAGKRAVVGVDRGRLRLRIDQRGLGQTPTRKYTMEQCGPKLFAIYTIDPQGKKERQGDVFYDGTVQSADYLFLLLALRLKQLGITQAQALVIIGDGASWIWNRVPDLRVSLSLADLRVVEIVDWAHAAEKLMSAAKAAFREPQQQQQWFKHIRTLLKQGDVSTILTALEALDQRHDQDEAIRTAIHYFSTHQGCMHCGQWRAEGFPLGSGSIESGVWRIVNLRLKGASLFWRPENAEEILYLRCQIKSGRWVTFVKSVLTQWKRPCDRRFVHNQKPCPSYTSSLSAVPARLRKTKTAPLRGCSRSPCRHTAAKPSMPLWKSTGSVARKMRLWGVSWSIRASPKRSAPPRQGGTAVRASGSTGGRHRRDAPRSPWWQAAGARPRRQALPPNPWLEAWAPSRGCGLGRHSAFVGHSFATASTSPRSRAVRQLLKRSPAPTAGGE
jgi:hypothetical protein